MSNQDVLTVLHTLVTNFFHFRVLRQLQRTGTSCKRCCSIWEKEKHRPLLYTQSDDMMESCFKTAEKHLRKIVLHTRQIGTRSHTSFC